jgi:DNA-binding transcriptional ArsR family regulator
MPKRITYGIELLADPARRRIVALIANGTRRPAGIADAIGLSRPATSHHLRLLVRARLLRWTFARFDRRGRLYMIEPTLHGPIIAWLAGVDLGRHPRHRDSWWSAPVDLKPDATDRTDRARRADAGVPTDSGPDVDRST